VANGMPPRVSYGRAIHDFTGMVAASASVRAGQDGFSK